MKKLLSILLLLSIGLKSIGQDQLFAVPNIIETKLVVLPPYPLDMKNIIDKSGNQIVIHNLFATTKHISLSFSLTSTDGSVSITSKKPVLSIILPANGTQVLPLSSLDPYLNINQINCSGVTLQEIATNKALPDGYYSFCVTPTDYLTNVSVGRDACSTVFPIMALEPPVLRLTNALNVDTVVNTTPQNLLFQWNLPTNPGASALASIKTNLKVVEVINGLTPEQAILNASITAPTFPINAGLTNFIYGPTMSPLIVGRRYAAVVQMTDPTGKVVFRNAGTSQVVSFVFGRPVYNPLVSLLTNAKGTVKWAYKATEESTVAGNTPLVVSSPIKESTISYLTNNSAGRITYPLANAIIEVYGSNVKPNPDGSGAVKVAIASGSSDATGQYSLNLVLKQAMQKFNFVTFIVSHSSGLFSKAVNIYPYDSIANGLAIPTSVLTGQNLELTPRVILKDGSLSNSVSIKILMPATSWANYSLLSVAGLGSGNGIVNYNNQTYSVVTTLTNGNTYKKLFQTVSPNEHYTVQVNYPGRPSAYFPLDSVYLKTYDGLAQKPVIAITKNYVYDNTVSVSGIVTYKGKPDMNVRVAVTFNPSDVLGKYDSTQKFIAVTETSGNYTITGLPNLKSGALFNFTFTDKTVSNLPLTSTLAVTSTSGILVKNFDIVVKKTIVSGQLTDIAGKAISNALVVVNATGITSHTDNTGRYLLQLVDGEIAGGLTFIADGYITKSIQLIASKSSLTINVGITILNKQVSSNSVLINVVKKADNTAIKSGTLTIAPISSGAGKTINVNLTNVSDSGYALNPDTLGGNPSQYKVSFTPSVANKKSLQPLLTNVSLVSAKKSTQVVLKVSDATPTPTPLTNLPTTIIITGNFVDKNGNVVSGIGSSNLIVGYDNSGTGATNQSQNFYLSGSPVVKNMIPVIYGITTINSIEFKCTGITGYNDFDTVFKAFANYTTDASGNGVLTYNLVLTATPVPIVPAPLTTLPGSLAINGNFVDNSGNAIPAAIAPGILVGYNTATSTNQLLIGSVNATNGAFSYTINTTNIPITQLNNIEIKSTGVSGYNDYDTVITVFANYTAGTNNNGTLNYTLLLTPKPSTALTTIPQSLYINGTFVNTSGTPIPGAFSPVVKVGYNTVTATNQILTTSANTSNGAFVDTISTTTTPMTQINSIEIKSFGVPGYKDFDTVFTAFTNYTAGTNNTGSLNYTLTLSNAAGPTPLTTIPTTLNITGNFVDKIGNTIQSTFSPTMVLGFDNSNAGLTNQSQTYTEKVYLGTFLESINTTQTIITSLNSVEIKGSVPGYYDYDTIIKSFDSYAPGATNTGVLKFNVILTAKPITAGPLGIIPNTLNIKGLFVDGFGNAIQGSSSPTIILGYDNSNSGLTNQSQNYTASAMNGAFTQAINTITTGITKVTSLEIKLTGVTGYYDYDTIIKDFQNYVAGTNYDGSLSYSLSLIAKPVAVAGPLTTVPNNLTVNGTFVNASGNTIQATFTPTVILGYNNSNAGLTNQTNSSAVNVSNGIFVDSVKGVVMTTLNSIEIKSTGVPGYFDYDTVITSFQNYVTNVVNQGSLSYNLILVPKPVATTGPLTIIPATLSINGNFIDKSGSAVAGTYTPTIIVGYDNGGSTNQTLTFPTAVSNGSITQTINTTTTPISKINSIEIKSTGVAGYYDYDTIIKSFENYTSNVVSQGTLNYSLLLVSKPVATTGPLTTIPTTLSVNGSFVDKNGVAVAGTFKSTIIVGYDNANASLTNQTQTYTATVANGVFTQAINTSTTPMTKINSIEIKTTGVDGYYDYDTIIKSFENYTSNSINQGAISYTMLLAAKPVATTGPLTIIPSNLFINGNFVGKSGNPVSVNNSATIIVGYDNANAGLTNQTQTFTATAANGVFVDTINTTTTPMTKINSIEIKSTGIAGFNDYDTVFTSFQNYTTNVVNQGSLSYNLVLVAKPVADGPLTNIPSTLNINGLFVDAYNDTIKYGNNHAPITYNATVIVNYNNGAQTNQSVTYNVSVKNGVFVDTINTTTTPMTQINSIEIKCTNVPMYIVNYDTIIKSFSSFILGANNTGTLNYTLPIISGRTNLNYGDYPNNIANLFFVDKFGIPLPMNYGSLYGWTVTLSATGDYLNGSGVINKTLSSPVSVSSEISPYTLGAGYIMGQLNYLGGSQNYIQTVNSIRIKGTGISGYQDAYYDFDTTFTDFSSYLPYNGGDPNNPGGYPATGVGKRQGESGSFGSFNYNVVLTPKPLPLTSYILQYISKVNMSGSFVDAKGNAITAALSPTVIINYDNGTSTNQTLTKALTTSNGAFKDSFSTKSPIISQINSIEIKCSGVPGYKDFDTIINRFSGLNYSFSNDVLTMKNNTLLLSPKPVTTIPSILNINGNFVDTNGVPLQGVVSPTLIVKYNNGKYANQIYTDTLTLSNGAFSKTINTNTMPMTQINSIEFKGSMGVAPNAVYIDTIINLFPNFTIGANNTTTLNYNIVYSPITGPITNVPTYMYISGNFVDKEGNKIPYSFNPTVKFGYSYPNYGSSPTYTYDVNYPGTTNSAFTQNFNVGSSVNKITFVEIQCNVPGYLSYDTLITSFPNYYSVPTYVGSTYTNGYLNYNMTLTKTGVSIPTLPTTLNVNGIFVDASGNPIPKSFSPTVIVNYGDGGSASKNLSKTATATNGVFTQVINTTNPKMTQIYSIEIKSTGVPGYYDFDTLIYSFPNYVAGTNSDGALNYNLLLVPIPVAGPGPLTVVPSTLKIIGNFIDQKGNAVPYASVSPTFIVNYNTATATNQSTSFSVGYYNNVGFMQSITNSSSGAITQINSIQIKYNLNGYVNFDTTITSFQNYTTNVINQGALTYTMQLTSSYPILIPGFAKLNINGTFVDATGNPHALSYIPDPINYKNNIQTIFHYVNGDYGYADTVSNGAFSNTWTNTVSYSYNIYSIEFKVTGLSGFNDYDTIISTFPNLSFDPNNSATLNFKMFLVPKQSAIPNTLYIKGNFVDAGGNPIQTVLMPTVIVTSLNSTSVFNNTVNTTTYTDTTTNGAFTQTIKNLNYSATSINQIEIRCANVPGYKDFDTIIRQIPSFANSLDNTGTLNYTMLLAANATSIPTTLTINGNFVDKNGTAISGSFSPTIQLVYNDFNSIYHNIIDTETVSNGAFTKSFKIVGSNIAYIRIRTSGVSGFLDYDTTINVFPTFTTGQNSTGTLNYTMLLADRATNIPATLNINGNFVDNNGNPIQISASPTLIFTYKDYNGNTIIKNYTETVTNSAFSQAINILGTQITSIEIKSTGVPGYWDYDSIYTSFPKFNTGATSTGTLTYPILQIAKQKPILTCYVRDQYGSPANLVGNQKVRLMYVYTWSGGSGNGGAEANGNGSIQFDLTSMSDKYPGFNVFYYHYNVTSGKDYQNYYGSVIYNPFAPNVVYKPDTVGVTMNAPGFTQVLGFPSKIKSVKGNPNAPGQFIVEGTINVSNTSSFNLGAAGSVPLSFSGVAVTLDPKNGSNAIPVTPVSFASTTLPITAFGFAPVQASNLVLQPTSSGSTTGNISGKLTLYPTTANSSTFTLPTAVLVDNTSNTDSMHTVIATPVSSNNLSSSYQLYFNGGSYQAVPLVSGTVLQLKSATLSSAGVTNLNGFLDLGSIAGVTPNQASNGSSSGLVAQGMVAAIQTGTVATDFSLSSLTFNKSDNSAIGTVAIQKIQASFNSIVINGVGTTNATISLGGNISLSSGGISIPFTGMTISNQNGSYALSANYALPDLPIKGIKFKKHLDASASMSYSRGTYNLNTIVDIGVDNSDADDASTKEIKKAIFSASDIQAQFNLQTANWGVFVATTGDYTVNLKVVTIHLDKLLINVGSNVSLDNMSAIMQGKATIPVATPGDTTEIVDGNNYWAFGISGSVAFPGVQSLSGQKDAPNGGGGTILLAQTPAGFAALVDKVYMHLETNTLQLDASASMEFSDVKKGFTASCSVQVKSFTKNTGIAGSFTYYSFAAGGIQLGASLTVSADIVTGPVTWHSLGGGFDFNTNSQQYNISFNGDCGPTGVPKEAMDVELKVNVLFSGDCNFVPIVKGSGTVTAGKVFTAQGDVTIDFCNKYLLANINATLPKPFDGVNASSTLFIAAPNSENGIDKGAFYYGIGIKLSIPALLSDASANFGVGYNASANISYLPQSVKDALNSITGGNVLNGLYISCSSSTSISGNYKIEVGPFTGALSWSESENFNFKFKADVPSGVVTLDVHFDASVNGSGEIKFLGVGPSISGNATGAFDLNGSYDPTNGFNITGTGSATLTAVAGVNCDPDPNMDCNSVDICFIGGKGKVCLKVSLSGGIVSGQAPYINVNFN